MKFASRITVCAALLTVGASAFAVETQTTRAKNPSQITQKWESRIARIYQKRALKKLFAEKKDRKRQPTLTEVQSTTSMLMGISGGGHILTPSFPLEWGTPTWQEYGTWNGVTPTPTDPNGDMGIVTFPDGEVLDETGFYALPMDVSNADSSALELMETEIINITDRVNTLVEEANADPDPEPDPDPGDPTFTHPVTPPPPAIDVNKTVPTPDGLIVYMDNVHTVAFIWGTAFAAGFSTYIPEPLLSKLSLLYYLGVGAKFGIANAGSGGVIITFVYNDVGDLTPVSVTGQKK